MLFQKFPFLIVTVFYNYFITFFDNVKFTNLVKRNSSIRLDKRRFFEIETFAIFFFFFWWTRHLRFMASWYLPCIKQTWTIWTANLTDCACKVIGYTITVPHYFIAEFYYGIDMITAVHGWSILHFAVWNIPPYDVIANFVYFDTNGESVYRLAVSNLAILT